MTLRLKKEFDGEEWSYTELALDFYTVENHRIIGYDIVRLSVGVSLNEDTKGFLTVYEDGSDLTFYIAVYTGTEDSQLCRVPYRNASFQGQTLACVTSTYDSFSGIQARSSSSVYAQLYS